MKTVTLDDLQTLYLPAPDSHKGQNGKLLIIGGSHLFHAASLWALKVASRIVDLVHYSSVPENNEIVKKVKEEFRDGIVVPRSEVESYIEEDDVILIGPGMVRFETPNPKHQTPNKIKIQNLKELEMIEDEGVQTAVLANFLLKKYPHKQWVIDAGALQMMDVELIPNNTILTPHRREFVRLWENSGRIKNYELRIMNKGNEEEQLLEMVKLFAQRHECIVLVKGETDIVCNGVEARGRICAPGECREIRGGNAGMTKGGTGDVLAGLIAALTCKNDPFLATIAGSFINKKAGESLFKQVGYYFNASDLADEIPKVMKVLVRDRKLIPELS
ncbi:NAD(P)H-hydrate dehydratase [Candidatus Gottesmanbacteria bacterium]|nr:NAD(P)H-hydrate dehydratase [Candidatus Gottesmanbacteria bacterium]